MHIRLRERLLPPSWLLTVLFVFLCLWLVVQLKEIVVLLVVGYSIVYVIDPLLSKLRHRGISRGMGVFIVAAAAIMAITVVALTAAPTVLREYNKLASNLPQYVSIAEQRFGALLDAILEYLPKDSAKALSGDISIATMLPAVNSQTVNELLLAVGSTLLKGYSVTLTILNLFLLPFIIYYLATSFKELHRGLIDLFPFHFRSEVREIGEEIDSFVSAYLHGQILVCTVLFFLYAVGLGILGVELWLLLAVIAGFGNMIPYLGFLVGIVLSSIMALVTFGDLFHLLLVWGVFAIVQFLEGTFITPKVVGKKVGLSPLTVILAIVAGGKLFGLLGVFLAVPAAAALRVLLRRGHAWVIRGL